MKNQPVEPEVVKEVPAEALARYEAPPSTLALSAVFDLDTAKKRLSELQEFVQFYMKEGEDFGIIPGTPKPTLYKSGADKLCDIYGIADQYKITNRTEDWSKNLFDYEVECTLTNKRDGSLVATGLGSCNSFEGKYRWRELKRRCPECGKETIIKGKQEWGGGWVCWNKPGKSDGCGCKFEDGDKQIEGQEVGKVENEDIPTLKNTLLKMAKKRAKIDAVLSATRSSGLFTQDIEDWDRSEEPRGTKEAAQKVAERKIAEAKTKNAAGSPRTNANNGDGSNLKDRHESITLTPYKGKLALSGPGLSIVRAEMTEDDKAFFGIKLYDKTVFCLEEKLLFKFQDLCTRLGVKAIGPNGSNSTLPKADIPPADVFPDQPDTQSTDPILFEAKAIEKSGKKPFMLVKWDGGEHSSFDKGLWPILLAAKGKPVMLETKANGKYSNVVRVVRMDGISFADEQNQAEQPKDDWIPF